MKEFKFLIPSVLSCIVLLAFSSCEITPNGPYPNGPYQKVIEPRLVFFSRPCDAINVFNIKLTSQYYSPEVPEGKGFQSMAEYGIRIDVNDEIREATSSDQDMFSWKQIERDADMEDEIKDSLTRVEWVGCDPVPTLNSEMPFFVDYRQEKLTGLKVFCSEKIFGEEPGTDISGHFMLCYFGDSFNHLLFSNDRHLVKEKWYGWTVDTMLSKGVLAMDSIFLGFSDFPEEVPQGDLYFEIELSVEGKEPFKAAAPPVNFYESK